MHMSEQVESDRKAIGSVPTIMPITAQLVQDERVLRERKTGQDLSLLITKATPYRIASGDILSVVVWDHPELSTPAMATPNASSSIDSGTTPPGYVIDSNGLVQFPYIGPTKLAGLTEQQARDLLAGKLARYVKKPDLTLRVQAYRSQRVYIEGEVKTPGIQPITDIPMTLPQALNSAGGILPSGDQSQISINRGGKSYRIDLPLLLQHKVDLAGIMLDNGDVVNVLAREESKVFVLGEVSKPVTLTLRNGRLSLNEALGEAGGVNVLSSNAGSVYVVRNAGADKPLVYHLDASSPVAFALAENFELQAKDVVYVDASKLAAWSRVMSLILPSALSVTNAVQAGK
ncbi:Polysaccharide export lipoprotein Wza [Collimonas arenae]|uniref:Polysaccharide export lipoprotein Wza n=2 Tax=Collimonas arenae TaxID=279058 RepID=A0A0A1FIF3_9BURK|nr:Polysaccharide export lipoprotein Wza [Collimonas arenae]